MRLWIESAQLCQGDAADGTPSDAETHAASATLSTLTTEESFLGLVMSGSLSPEVESRARLMVHGPWSSSDVDGLLSALPVEGHAPLALLHVRDGACARLVECDAPPLFMARRGRLVLLPVVEEEVRGHLVRRCEFELRDGDHLAMVSEGYIQGIRAGTPKSYVGWREVAVSIRRLTETRCSAEQLAGALIRQYQRQGTRDQGPGIGGGPLATSHQPSAISVLAMFVRPMRSITIWSGPPASRAAERGLLDALMAEEDMRAVCGDTTAEIAARLLGAELVMEPRPSDGWAEVPPVSWMTLPGWSEPVAMVTEGLVTMRVAGRRLAEATLARDLVGREDGASRLAHLLVSADRVRFLVGLAVNPAQVAPDGTPLRRWVVEELAEDLKARGKIVSVEHF
jgi:hypothetical protein